MPNALAMDIDNRYKSVLKEAERYHLRHLSELNLRTYFNTLNQEQEKIVDELDDLRKELNSFKEANNPSAVLESKDSIRRLKNRFTEVKDEKKKVWNALQEKILYNRQLVYFKHDWIIKAKEGLIFFLIMFVLGLLYIEFTTPSLSGEIKNQFFWLDTIACGFFLLNFFFELRLSDSWRWYWRTHWIDFITSIPIPTAEVLRLGRTARLLRLIRFLRVLRTLRFVGFIARGLDKYAEVMDVNLMKRSFIYAVMLLLSGGLIIFFIEQDQGAGVSTVSESIWWSFTTLVTGGYGDIHNPQSGLGRALTVILVIAGMILVGVFTATLTSLLVADDAEKIQEIQESQNELREKLDALANRIKNKE